jgi:hypothetical protein
MLGDLRETLVKFKDDIDSKLDSIKDDLKPLSKGVGYLLQELLDPWEKIHSETKSQVEDNERENLMPVTDYYGCPIKKYCMVLGAVSRCQIKCSHIWPKWTKGAGLEVLELSQNEVNSPRNFLRLHETIEKASDKKKLYFLLGLGLGFFRADNSPTVKPHLASILSHKGSLSRLGKSS